MLSDAIRRWNPWWAEKRVSDSLLGVEREKLRDIEMFLGQGLIKGIVGPRRAGKTTLLYQIIGRLIDRGEDPKNIMLLNFDDNSIYNADFDTILSESRKISPNIKYIFLDEVQEKIGWERWVRTLHDTHQFSQIFVTGSSSSLLKEDVGRVLTGRHITFHLFPFSFRESLKYRGWSGFSKDVIEYKKGDILHHLYNYMKTGGYPEALKMGEMARNRYLNELFDDILARDISALRRADYHLARRIAYYVISHSSRTMTYRSVARATGVAVDTVSKYLRYMEDAYLTIPLRMFSYKLKEQMREINKYYAIDQGLANAVSYKFSENQGWNTENIVFLELYRKSREKLDMEIYYWKDAQQREVDFVVKEEGKVKELIQVTYASGKDEIERREIRALEKAGEELRCKNKTIITWDYEEDGEINYIPLWKWLLNPHK